MEPMAEMLRAPGFPLVEAKVQLRARHAETFAFTGVGDDSVELLHQVARGEVDLATMNPSGLLTAAYRGKGPFPEPMDIRIVTVIPSLDWLGFFVAKRTGLQSLAEVREQRYPLRVSLRGSPTNVTQVYAHEVLAAYGFSFDDIVSWGGSVIREDLMAFHPDRYGKVKTGEIDAIVDEGIRQLIPLLDDLEMRMLPIDEPVLRRMDEIGLHRATLPRALFASLPSDVPTLCFSGFPVYTHAGAPDDLIYGYCKGLDARHDSIPYDLTGPLPLADMCRDTPAAPLRIPLHPAAERYWREAGYLR
jgi:TRAP-type uncharacterized transport system substrate-binding protein